MNNKLHLLYGIIIGILLCASFGAKGSFLGSKYKHMAVYQDYYPSDPENKQYMISGPSDSFLDEALENGFEVIDFEYDSNGKPSFLLAHPEKRPSISSK